MDFQKLMNVATKNERKAQKEVCCNIFGQALNLARPRNPAATA